MSIYAHSNGPEIESWQTLADHSENVAKMASSFAAPFNSSSQAELAGKVHDVGKARSSFQSYIRRCNGIEVDGQNEGDHSHSGAGAAWLFQNAGAIGKALAYCVAGHHAGLPDWSNGSKPNGTLSARMEEEKVILDEQSVHDWISSHESELLELVQRPAFKFDRDNSSFSFWIRMVYSCLVDADFLDTEAFMDKNKSALRDTGKSLTELSKVFFKYLDEKQMAASDTPVNRIRAEIRTECENAVKLDPGIFSLTVPTGGGKTLSGTAFALKHALEHGLKRIIYVIPYTSIIEQTADALREIFGEENVLEHHSNFDPDKETVQSRLASENWNAPIIVTTTVQFFESIYGCKSSRCRKLHNIAESVVILDEVQLLPTKLLLPCAEAISQLSRNYKTSFVLSTATQLNLPGLGSENIHEIIPESMDLYRRLKRTNIEFPSNRSERISWKDLAVELCKHERVLCIVNTRRDCRELFGEMPEGTIHLSASMCGEHRSRVIAEIKNKLKNNESVRVISTQLVEAGVDIDFPIVYRAFTGLASIAQSAGRCNREGKLSGNGRVVVFIPPKESPRGELRQGEYAMADLLDRQNGVDPDDANCYPDYFHALHRRVHDLGTTFRSFLGVRVPVEFAHGTVPSAPDAGKYQFREAAEAFHMIDNESTAVIVRYGESDRLIDQLRKFGPSRWITRRLQRYSVNVPNNTVEKLVKDGIVEELTTTDGSNEPSGIFVQHDPSRYSDVFGFDLFS